jgi:PIN domain nuclease of toxin-antitoxin system
MAVTAADAPAVVLDASALLAYAFGEPGGEAVGPLIAGALISAANWSEWFQKVAQRGVATAGLRAELEALGLVIVPVDAEQAEQAAGLWPLTRPLGLSLADRLCLALGQAHLPARVVTADRAWLALQARLPEGLIVDCVRPPQALHEPT